MITVFVHTTSTQNAEGLIMLIFSGRIEKSICGYYVGGRWPSQSDRMEGIPYGFCFMNLHLLN